MSALSFSYNDLDKELVLLLLHCEGVGRKTVRKILYYLKKHEVKSQRFWVDVCAILEKLSISKNIENKIKSIKKEQELLSIKKYLIDKDIRVIFFWEVEYPKLLLESDDFPLLLFVKGTMQMLQNPALAVVGTRRITSYGEMVTKQLVSDLTIYGYTIVSGCMYGVDAIAHQAAVEAQGNTIAVLGYGFAYRPSHRIQKLQTQILESGGCLVTEYAPQVQPSKGTFPERNRIVAGISMGVLVTEAALKSGTHITAECALDAGREVFAVPGSIFNPYAQGTKHLINQGATLVTSAADIVADLRKPITIPFSTDKNQTDLDMQAYIEHLEFGPVEKKVLQELFFLPQSVDALCEKLQLEIQELLSILSVLELENIVQNKAGVWHCVLSYSGRTTKKH